VNFLQGDAERSASGLTEFEGALVTELGRRQPCTAYQLRRLFMTSPSRSWSGSAGAVYPAVRRLTEAGLISGEAAGVNRRGGANLQLTSDGERARRAWITDAERAADSGFDPFRTRATLLDTVPAGERAAFADALTAKLQARIEWLERFAAEEDAVSQARAAIDIAQQRYRLAWLADWRKDQG
jgi:DNA-binding PadR family transcriptional regulator